MNRVRNRSIKLTRKPQFQSKEQRDGYLADLKRRKALLAEIEGVVEKQPEKVKQIMTNPIVSKEEKDLLRKFMKLKLNLVEK